MSGAFELLELQDNESVKNSFYRSPRQIPNIEKKHDKLEIKTIETTIYISKLEEVILYIIADFKFSPFWLIQQWFEIYSINGFEQVSKWINVGIVWAETSTMGVFIRPTKFLLDLFQVEDTRYIEIPFGLLNHTCGEEQLVFDVMTGNPKSEIWYLIKDKKLLPCYHPLAIEPEDESGTIVIREGNFKANRFKPEELLANEDLIKREIRAGKHYTSEFSDFSMFPIVNYTDENELITQTPDVLIPIPRTNKPESIAIEIELSAKTADKYLQIMKNYQNNIKFGTLVYLAGTPRIARLVKDAFVAVKGLGTCDLFLIPFTPPAMRLSNFSIKDEQEQGQLLVNTAKSTSD